mgnify:CR=1 FL=1
MIHTITQRTKAGSIIHYSPRKIDIVYKHTTFKYKDKARYREVTESQFEKMRKSAIEVVQL